MGADTKHINSFDQRCILHNMAKISLPPDIEDSIIEATKELINHQYVCFSFFYSNTDIEIYMAEHLFIMLLIEDLSTIKS